MRVSRGKDSCLGREVCLPCWEAAAGSSVLPHFGQNHWEKSCVRNKYYINDCTCLRAQGAVDYWVDRKLKIQDLVTYELMNLSLIGKIWLILLTIQYSYCELFPPAPQHFLRNGKSKDRMHKSWLVMWKEGTFIFVLKTVYRHCSFHGCFTCL